MSNFLFFVTFQVFSLGNKTYEHFNAMGKYVDKRMEELGATRVHENGIGDDDAKYVSKSIISIQKQLFFLPLSP